MAIENLRKELAKMTADISNVQTAITETSEASESLTKRIAGLAQSSTKGGALWSVIGRFSSGGAFYDIQNKTRSIAFLFKLKDNFDKERVANETKINTILSNGIKRREKLLTIAKMADKSKITALVKGRLLHDDTLKIQMKQLGFAEAIGKEAFRANKALKESVLSEASTIDSREYGRREDKSDLFKKLGGVAGGNLGDRQDLAVGIDSKTDEFNEQLNNLTALREKEEEEQLERERIENKLQDNYNNKERVKVLKASLAREKNVKIEGDITDKLLAAKVDLLTKEKDLISGAEETIRTNQEVLAEMIEVQTTAGLAYAKSEKDNYGFVNTRLKLNKESSDAARVAAKAELDLSKLVLKNLKASEEAKEKEFTKLTEDKKKSDRNLKMKKANQQRKIDKIEDELLNSKELSLADEDKLRDDLSTQKDIQKFINGELGKSEELIKAYNSELEILIENAEDSGLVIVDKDEGGFNIDEDSGEIETGTGIVTETSKGKKDKPKFVNPREKRKLFSTDSKKGDGTGKLEKIRNLTGFGMQTDDKQGGLFSKIYGKEMEDRGLRSKSGEGKKPDAFKLSSSIGKKFGIDKRKLSGIFKFAKTGFMVFGKALLFIGLIGLLVFVMKKTGVFEKIGDMYDKFVDSGLLTDTIAAFTNVFSGIFDMLIGTFELLSALFEGDSGGAWAALEKIKDGFIDLLKGIGGIMLYGLLGAIGIIFSMIISSAVSRVSRNLKLIKEEGLVGAGKVMKNIIEWAFKRLVLVAIATAVGAAIGFFFGGPPGAILGAKAGGIVGGLASAMETGGITHKTGNYLVGEGGPEIISLPGNTQVHNNSDSKRMMGNNINVTVSGRVGASEQELNDIARRIGQKVNLEMNRYSNSGYRG